MCIRKDFLKFMKNRGGSGYSIGFDAAIECHKDEICKDFVIRNLPKLRKELYRLNEVYSKLTGDFIRYGVNEYTGESGVLLRDYISKVKNLSSLFDTVESMRGYCKTQYERNLICQ